MRMAAGVDGERTDAAWLTTCGISWGDSVADASGHMKKSSRTCAVVSDQIPSVAMRAIPPLRDPPVNLASATRTTYALATKMKIAMKT